MDVDRLIEVLTELQRQGAEQGRFRQVAAHMQTGDLIVLGPEGIIGKVDAVTQTYVPTAQAPQNGRRVHISPKAFDLLDRLTPRPS
jgi:preprotein translocase subunit YajC